MFGILQLHGDVPWPKQSLRVVRAHCKIKTLGEIPRPFTKRSKQRNTQGLLAQAYRHDSDRLGLALEKYVGKDCGICRSHFSVSK
jgi:hypothetical protein